MFSCIRTPQLLSFFLLKKKKESVSYKLIKNWFQTNILNIYAFKPLWVLTLDLILHYTWVFQIPHTFTGDFIAGVLSSSKIHNYYRADILWTCNLPHFSSYILFNTTLTLDGIHWHHSWIYYVFYRFTVSLVLFTEYIQFEVLKGCRKYWANMRKIYKLSLPNSLVSPYKMLPPISWLTIPSFLFLSMAQWITYLSHSTCFIFHICHYIMLINSYSYYCWCTSWLNESLWLICTHNYIIQWLHDCILILLNSFRLGFTNLYAILLVSHWSTTWDWAIQIELTQLLLELFLCYPIIHQMNCFHLNYECSFPHNPMHITDAEGWYG